MPTSLHPLSDIALNLNRDEDGEYHVRCILVIISLASLRIVSATPAPIITAFVIFPAPAPIITTSLLSVLLPLALSST
jgi:hypothetical protein